MADPPERLPQVKQEIQSTEMEPQEPSTDSESQEPSTKILQVKFPFMKRQKSECHEPPTGERTRGQGSREQDSENKNPSTQKTEMKYSRKSTQNAESLSSKTNSTENVESFTPENQLGNDHEQNQLRTAEKTVITKLNKLLDEIKKIEEALPRKKRENKHDSETKAPLKEKGEKKPDSETKAPLKEKGEKKPDSETKALLKEKGAKKEPNSKIAKKPPRTPPLELLRKEINVYKEKEKEPDTGPFDFEQALTVIYSELNNYTKTLCSIVSDLIDEEAGKPKDILDRLNGLNVATHDIFKLSKELIGERAQPGEPQNSVTSKMESLDQKQEKRIKELQDAFENCLICEKAFDKSPVKCQQCTWRFHESCVMAKCLKCNKDADGTHVDCACCGVRYHPACARVLAIENEPPKEKENTCMKCYGKVSEEHEPGADCKVPGGKDMKDTTCINCKRRKTFGHFTDIPVDKTFKNRWVCLYRGIHGDLRKGISAGGGGAYSIIVNEKKDGDEIQNDIIKYKTENDKWTNEAAGRNLMLKESTRPIRAVRRTHGEGDRYEYIGLYKMDQDDTNSKTFKLKKIKMDESPAPNDKRPAPPEDSAVSMETGQHQEERQRCDLIDLSKIKQEPQDDSPPAKRPRLNE